MTKTLCVCGHRAEDHELCNNLDYDDKMPCSHENKKHVRDCECLDYRVAT